MHQSDNDIRNRLLIARLPAMPQMLIKLIEHLQADDLGMQELAALVSTDPGMTSKILSVANSSAYHRASSRSVGLEQSLVALGTVAGDTRHLFSAGGSEATDRPVTTVRDWTFQG